MELILKNKFFQYNNKNYIQTLETVMGTELAPTYNTLKLAYLEENLHEIKRRKYSNYTKTELIKPWKRYQDDSFIMWKCS